ncbi:MAG: sugar phosphate isomerase/epimerase family protein [Planctomycetota bacterium]
MTGQLSRRNFILSSGALLASTGPLQAAARSLASAPAGNKKAVKLGMVQGEMSLLQKFQLLKELGFDGVELDSPNQLDLAEVIAARDTSGLPIHGVVDSVHWRKTLSHPDLAVRKEGIAGLETALRDAKAYGASSVLLVPAVVNKRVSYADAYSRSQECVRQVLPLAEELQIQIAFENVWNKFLLSPIETARYIDEFDSEWVGAYFDVGNVVTYGWPEHWVRTLGSRIFKIDVKEFSRKKQDENGPCAGFRVELLEGDCDWPAVMGALREVGFEGWFTAEIPGGGRERLQDISERMSRILAL